MTYTAGFQTVGSTWLAENQSSKEHELSIPVDKNQWLFSIVDQKGRKCLATAVVDYFNLMAIDCRLPRQLRFAKLATADEATDG